MVSSKKTAECQYRRNDRSHSLGYRRLRFSFQINDFKDLDRRTGPHCFAPVVGGGGDVVASEDCVKKFLGGNFLGRSDPEVGGGGDVVASDFRVKQFFLKKNFSLRPRPGGRRRRLPKEGHFLCQPDFSAISRIGKPELSRPQKTVGRSERLPSGIVSDDSIGARRLCGPGRRSKKFLRLPSSVGPRDLRLRGPGGRPVSERGGSIRRGLFVRKRLFLGRALFSRSHARRARATGSGLRLTR